MAKKYIAKIGEQEIPVEISTQENEKLEALVGGKKVAINVHQVKGHHYHVIYDGQSMDIRFFKRDTQVQAFVRGECLTFTLEDEASLARKKSMEGRGGVTPPLQGRIELKSQMPGKIVKVEVKVGDKVTSGQGIVIMEAMKMENEIISPKAGEVKELKVQEGQSVESGALLAVIE